MTIALQRGKGAQGALRKTGRAVARNVTGLIVHESGATANGPRRAIGPETTVPANFGRETFGLVLTSLFDWDVENYLKE